MKKLPFLLPVLFACYLSNGQSCEPVFANREGIAVPSTLKLFGGNLFWADVTDNKMQLGYTFKLSKVKFSITLAEQDLNMKPVKKNVLSNGGRVYGPLPPQLQKIGDDLYLVYYQFMTDDENNDLKILAARVDTATLNLDKPKELFSLNQKNLGLFKAEDFFKNHRLILKESPDHTKLLALWNSGGDDEVRIHMLDQHLNTLWTKTESPANKKAIRIYDALPDNKGVVYLGYKVWHDRLVEGHVLVVQENAKAINKTIRVPGGYPYEIRLAAARNAPLINIAGGYIGATNLINGVFSALLNTDDLNLSKPDIIEASRGLIDTLKKNDWALTKSNNYGILPITMLAYSRGDGSVDLIGELMRNDFMYNSAVGESGYFYSGDILWVHITGEKASFNRVPKFRRLHGGMVGDGYCTLVSGDQLFVFYNDSEKDLKGNVLEEPASSDELENIVPVVATLGADGKIRRFKVDMPVKDNDLVAEPYEIQSTGDGVIFPVMKRKNHNSRGITSQWVPINPRTLSSR